MARLELSRRQVLEALAVCGVAGAATSCVPRRIGADHATNQTRGSVGPSATRLVTRLSFGPTPDSLALAEQGIDAYLDDQLDADIPDTSQMVALFTAIDARGETVAEGAGDSANADRRRAALETASLRAVTGAAWSSRQLHALLTDFWSDHLHVSIGEQPEMFFVPSYDSEVIRAHAMGNFAEMLVASARSAAMLIYLDQANSRADGDNVPNENFARELMELHTVGVDGGYDETDVIEAAHILTGWSTRRRSSEFQYRSSWHDLGPLEDGGDVLGFTPSGTGESDGEGFLSHLAHLPATATHVCHRLAVRLVGDDVGREDPVVQAASDAFLDEDTSIPAAVRAIVGSDAFASAAPIARRPLDLVAATLRTGCKVATEDQLDGLVRGVGGSIRPMGQAPWQWPAPNGYPLQGAAWIDPGSMVGRFNTALSAGDGFGVLDPAEGTWPDESTAPVDVATRLLGREPSQALVDALSNQVGANEGTSGEDDSRAIASRALVFASPDFQER